MFSKQDVALNAIAAATFYFNNNIVGLPKPIAFPHQYILHNNLCRVSLIFSPKIVTLAVHGPENGTRFIERHVRILEFPVRYIAVCSQ